MTRRGIFILWSAVILSIIGMAWITRGVEGQTLPTTAPTTIPAPQISIWRNFVRPGSTDYVWNSTQAFPAGVNGTPIAGTFTIQRAVSPIQPAPVLPIIQQPLDCWQCWDDANDYAAITIPQLPAGNYLLNPGAIPITIEPTVNPSFAPTIGPPVAGQDYSQQIQADFAAGKSVQLTPGVFSIAHQIDVERPDLTLAGSGPSTILRRINSADYGNRMFFTNTGAPWLTLADLNVDFRNTPWGILLHTQAQFQNLELSNVGANLAMLIQGAAPGAWIHDSQFRRSSTFIADHQLWQQDEFSGIGQWANETICGGDSPILLNCKWLDTGRGLIFRGGPTNGYFGGLTLDGLSHIPNGNEALNDEQGFATGLYNNVFSHVTVRNSATNVLTLWHSAASGSLLKHFKLFGGATPFLMTGEPQENGNTLSDWQSPRAPGSAPTTLPSGQTFINFLNVRMNNQ